VRVVVAGASGLVGSSLARRLGLRHSVLALTHSDLDVADAEAVQKKLSEATPHLVVNAAVLGVDACEENPALARRVNEEGAAAVARAAAETRALLVHLSTNYVFDGDRDPANPYTVEDTPRPINVYGRTKLDGEEAVRRFAPESFVVRTSWVYGRGRETFLGSVPARLRRGEGVRAITDLFGNTAYLEDLTERIEEIVERRRFGTYHVVNEGVTTYEAFAREAARLVGLDERAASRQIETVREGDLSRKAPRPRSTPLRCLLSEDLGLPPLRGWREALAAWVRTDG